MTVDLSTGTAVDGFGSVDTLVNIEFLTGSSHDDILIGDSVSNQLLGLGGADTLDDTSSTDRDRGRGGPGADTCTANVETCTP